MTTTRATTAQRERIYNLLNRCEYGMDRVSVPHRALAQRAQIAIPERGMLVDSWIDSLDKNGASALIAKLSREADHDHE